MTTKKPAVKKKRRALAKKPTLDVVALEAGPGPPAIKERLNPVNLRDSINIAKTASRFGVTREDVKAAVRQIEQERAAPVEITAERRASEMLQYLRAEYDRCARTWGFEDMVQMMATTHTEIIARALQDPSAFGREALKAIKDLAPLIYPPEKITATRKLSPGDSKLALVERLFKRLKQGQYLSPERSEPLELQKGESVDPSD